MQPASSISPDASALERLPHVTRTLCGLWGKEEFEGHLNGLIMDSRDGKRQGLPADAVEDLLFLMELTIAKRALFASESTGMPYQQAFLQYLEKSRTFAPSDGEADDPWSNPRDRQDVSRSVRKGHGAVPAPAAPLKHRRVHRKKSWWRRLFG